MMIKSNRACEEDLGPLVAMVASLMLTVSEGDYVSEDDCC